VEIYKTDKLDLSDVADDLDPPKPRDNGRWHVSNLLESAQLITKGDIRYAGGNEVPDFVRTLGHMGRIWEAAADAHITKWAAERGGTYISNAVMEKDDIVASLDGIMMMPEVTEPEMPESVLMVVEIKLRFARSTDIPFRHQQQVLSYCSMLNTNLVCYVDAHIASNPPEAFGFIRFIKFTEREIEENWQMLTATKEYLESKGCGPENPK